MGRRKFPPTETVGYCHGVRFTDSAGLSRMTELHLFPAAVAFLAAFLAGAINSVAGGGTLVSFPALVWLGLPSVTANATSTVAIVPGSLAGAWGYRRELRSVEQVMFMLIVPSL